MKKIKDIGLVICVSPTNYVATCLLYPSFYSVSVTFIDFQSNNFYIACGYK